MSENTQSAAPKWFFIVSLIALIWNLLGVAAYVMQVTMSPDMLAALPQAQRELMESTPAWATAAFALAVNGGALGCLFLVLKKRLATPILIISLAGVVVQMIHSFFFSNSFAVFGPGGMVMPVMVLVISACLVVLSRSASSKGWLN